MKDIVNEKLNFKTKFALLINILIEECPIPYIIWLLFIVYETIIYIALPISIPTIVNAQYASFKKALLLIPYVRAVFATGSYVGIGVLTVGHFLITCIVPVITIGLLAFADLKKKSKTTILLGKVCILVMIVEYSFTFVPMSRNFFFVIFNYLSIELSLSFKVISAIGYVNLLYSAIISPMLFSVPPCSHVPWAGIFTLLHYQRSMIKIVIAVYMSVDFQLQYSGIATIIFILPILIYLIRSMSTQMFYRSTLYFAYTFQMTLFLLLMIILQIMNLAHVNVVVEDLLTILVISLICSVLILIYQTKRHSALLMKLIEKIENENEAENYIISLYRLMSNKKSQLVLVGILTKNKKWLGLNQEDYENAYCSIIRAESQAFHSKIYGFFDKIYCSLSNLFEKSQLIKLIYSLYTWKIYKNTYKSYFIALKTFKYNINIHMLIVAVKQLNDLSQFFEISNNTIFNHIYSCISFNTLLACLSSNCSKASNHMMKLFKWLCHTEINMKLIQNEVISISECITEIENYYSKILSASSLCLESFHRMCCFYSLVLNSEAYTSKYEEMSEKQRAQIGLMTDYSKIFDCSNEILIIIMSGDEANLESILYISNESTTLLNYHPKELLKQSITLIMPYNLRDGHKSFISSFHETGIAKIMNRRQSLFALSKQCVLVPVNSYITTLLYITRNARYIGFLIKQSEAEVYKEFNFPYNLQYANPIIWMLSLDGYIIGMNDASYNFLGIPLQYVEIKKGILKIKANVFISNIDDMMAHPERYTQGLMTEISYSNIHQYLDIDLLEELKITKKQLQSCNSSIYVRIQSANHNHIEYFILLISVVSEIGEKNNKELFASEKDQNKLTQSSLSLGSVKKAKYNREARKQISFKLLILASIVLIAECIITNTSFMLHANSVLMGIMENVKSSTLLSSTNIFLLNIVSSTQYYAYNLKKHIYNPKKYNYLLTLVKQFSQYLTNNGEHAMSPYTIKSLEIDTDGSFHYTSYTVYNVLLKIVVKLHYLLISCNTTADLLDSQLNILSPDDLQLTQPVSECTQYTYEVMIGSYYCFYMSSLDVISSQMDSGIQTLVDAKGKLIMNVEILSVSLAASFVILGIFAYKIKTENALLYNEILAIPKKTLTSRMIRIKQYNKVSESNLEMKNYLKMQQEKSDAASIIDPAYYVKQSKKKAKIPLPTLTKITLIWIGVVVTFGLLILASALSKWNELYRHYGYYSADTYTKLYGTEASYLYLLSCIYKTPIFYNSFHSVDSLTSIIKDNDAALADNLDAIIANDQLAYNVCAALTNYSSPYYMPYINSSECNTTFYNIFGHRTSEIMALYYISITTSYFSIIKNASYGISAAIFDNMITYTQQYINPINLMLLKQISDMITSMLTLYYQLNMSYYVITLLMLIGTVFLTAVSFGNSFRQKLSIEMMQQYIKTKE